MSAPLANRASATIDAAMPDTVGAVIVAAGSGTPMGGGDKLFTQNGKQARLGWPPAVWGLGALGPGAYGAAHAGARPLVTPDFIERGIEAARETGAAIP